MKAEESYLKKRSPKIDSPNREEDMNNEVYYYVINKPCNNKKNGYANNKLPQNDHINDYQKKRNASTPRHYDKPHNNYHYNKNYQYNHNMPAECDRFYQESENMFPFNMSMMPMNVPIGMNGIPMGMTNMAVPNMMNMGYYNQYFLTKSFFLKYRIPPWGFAGMPNYCNFYPGKFRYDKRNDGYRGGNDYMRRDKYPYHNKGRDSNNYNRENDKQEKDQKNESQVQNSNPNPQRPENFQASGYNDDSSRRNLDRGGKNINNRSKDKYNNGWNGPNNNYYSQYNNDRNKPNRRNWSMRDSP